MPTGQDLVVAQSVPPTNSSTAIATVPPARLYDPSAGVPQQAMNAGMINGPIAFNGGSVSRTVDGPNPSVIAAINRAFGTNISAAKYTQASLSSVQNSVNAGFTTTANAITTTQGQVSFMQATIDANQMFNQEQYGFQSIDYATEVMWNWSSSQNYYNTEVQKLNDAAMGGALMVSQVLQRLQSSVNFLVWYFYAEQSQGYYDVEDLNAASVQGLIASGMDVLTYLTTVLPEYPWQENQDGTGLVGMSWLSSTDSLYRSYYWSPPGPSLYDIYHLWDYEPSSGGPLRNGITDFISIISLLPVTY